MRFRNRAVLGIILVVLVSLPVLKSAVLAQSVQIDQAHGQLLRAFASVQQADEQGVSQTRVLALADSLNLALEYEENATLLMTTNVTASNSVANQSSTLSSSIMANAMSLSSAARSQSFIDQAAVYSSALIAAFCTALLFLELHRLTGLARRMRFRRMSID